MVCMTKQQFETELEEIQRRNETIEYRRRLRKERWKHIPKFTLPSTSKIVLIVSGVLCIEILAFCQYMIMVGALFTFMAVVLGYFVKSTKENSAGGITYETAMAGITSQAPPVQTNEAVG